MRDEKTIRGGLPAMLLGLAIAVALPLTGYAAEPADATMDSSPVTTTPDAPLPATPAADSDETSGPSVSFGELPRGLSPWRMYQDADAVVKGVILSLLAASLLTWTVWLAKSCELSKLRKTMRRSLIELNDATSLPVESATSDPIVALMVSAARQELAQVTGSHLATAAVTDRVVAKLERIEAAATRHVNRGTNVLASIGSTAPFVGLFGTVWGIMNSFIGISEAKTTNLAVVAPGIAEALLATAIGLVAAIPAVLFYNAFAKSIATYRALVVDAATYVSCLVSREVDRSASGVSAEPQQRHVAAVR